ncbi:MAG: hypothetical protein AB7O92_24585 [Acidimicrobiia bacterium]
MQTATLPGVLTPDRLAVVLVEVLVQLDRDDLALDLAHRQGLVTDDQLVAAWEQGRDVLAAYRQAAAL